MHNPLIHQAERAKARQLLKVINSDLFELVSY